MSVECANRSWAKKQAPLLLGFLIMSGAARRDEPTRGAGGISRAEASDAVTAAPELASTTGDRDRPLRPEEPSPLLPLSDGPAHSTEVPGSRSLALGAKGTVFVRSQQDQKVYALVDDDGDHEVDRVHVVARGLDALDWSTYRDRASSNAELSRMLGVDGFEARPDRLPKPIVVVTDKLSARAHHGWRYVRFGVGGWLYIPVRVTYQS